jgi:cell cycle sensor histidine kinase DivJ
LFRRAAERHADRRPLEADHVELTSNAITHPAGGSVTLTLTITRIWSWSFRHRCRHRSRDPACRPFEQAGAVEQKVQGTGLGLSLVRALAELHGAG